MDIIVSHLCKAYGSHIVYNDFSHCFPAGRTSCILGPSGCGKTTLFRLIAGLETPDGGAISGVDPHALSAVFQEDRLLEQLTAERNVLLTARPGFTRGDARDLLNALGLTDTAQRTAEMSGGMRRRLAIARALAANYRLLLMDEPLTGMDGDTRANTLALIKKMTAGKTVIWITHDTGDAQTVADETLTLTGER